ncbi:MAG: hypothetical protein CMP48_25155 [Rickettsiales bacterium]|nr:hypothetical protein [Rickettsiales bacterium]
MPLILNFLKFAGGGLLRFAPLVLAPLIASGKKLSQNKDLKKYALPALIVIGAIYVWYTREEKQLVEDLGGDPVRKATLLSRYLGTNKALSWWQPTTWYEDEDSAFELLISSLNQLNQIEKEYNNISESGSLRIDIEKYLTTDQINELYGSIN